MEEISKEILELLKNCTYEEKSEIIKNIIEKNPISSFSGKLP